MSDLRAKLAAAGDRETVELPGIGTVEVRSCRVGERMELMRLSAIAAESDGQVAKLLAATKAQCYLIAVTARDPGTGALLFDPAAYEEVESGMDGASWEKLGEVAMRVSGLDKLAEQAGKNVSRASEESSTALPEISTVLSKNSEDGSLHLSTVSG